MTADAMQRVLQICLELTAKRDREELLSSILDTGMDVAHCDAGTLYLLSDDGLRFCRMVTRSQGVRQGGHADPIRLPPVPIDPKYVCAWVAIHNKTINVPDVRDDAHFDFTGSLRYDAMTGYRTKSMLVVPMLNDKGELIGVMQLINALDEAGNAIPFDRDVEFLVNAVASQAALSIVNMQYAEQITALLDSLVGALSSAIDERSPYNANHTRNMVRLGESFLDYLDRIGSAYAFSEARRRAFLMSVWLHDVGKLTVPAEIMDKESRLGPELARVQDRFRQIALCEHIAFLEGRFDETEYRKRCAELADACAFIERINTAGYLPDADLLALEKLAGRSYTDENGETHPLLSAQELTQLRVRKGTLTDAEREIMQNHVVVTGRILSHVAFPKLYETVPCWAAAHHELLNGKGYPQHLSGDEIPTEVRILTILDVFEALTARDRPYKPPMPVEKALGILDSMVTEGAIDPDLFALFRDSRAWEETNDVHTGNV